jgi:hypothetical protein
MLIKCILDNPSLKQGSLFCFVCHAEISKITILQVVLLVYSDWGASILFEIVWSYSVQAS